MTPDIGEKKQEETEQRLNNTTFEEETERKSWTYQTHEGSDVKPAESKKWVDCHTCHVRYDVT